MSKYLKFATPAAAQAGDLKSRFGIGNHGLTHIDRVYWNLPAPALYEEATFRNEGSMAHGGPFVVNTGKWSARAAQEKYVVRENSTEDKIWWGEYNRPYNPELFAALHARIQAFLQDEELFVQDCYVGADPKYRMPVRIITEYAWHSLFARNLFITPQNQDDYQSHVPEFTVIVAPSFHCDPRLDGTRSSTAIILDFSKRLVLICNTSYAGEIKKSLFTVMNFLLPLREVLAMHCSANVGKDGDVALFFGLSGTGKTTLSADPNRRLIGDDEHGWSDDGVFNFEGGCYAKVIRLSPEGEPEIYQTTRRFGTILENVAMDSESRRLDCEPRNRSQQSSPPALPLISRCLWIQSWW